MVERFTHGPLLWVSITEPTNEETHHIMQELNVPPTLMADLSGPVPKSSATVIDRVLKITLDFPIVKRTDINHPHEIKFLIAKNYLITVQYEDIGAVETFKREFEIFTDLHKNEAKKMTGAHLFFSLMKELYENASTKLDYIESRFSDIENGIFKGHEKEMVFEISTISKRVIAFRQILTAHHDVLHKAKPCFEDVFKHRDTTHELDRLHAQYLHVVRRTTALAETLDELRDTNLALLTTKQNEIMKIFTILAFITFPLTLFTSMFGMNTTTTPIIGREGDFWIILGIMIIVSITFFVYFKYKKWI
ncbi:magnesium transporter CorA family protein [Candidatus Kaiserbacteria bacterium]|nr:magnesium transporter CorA family protein [Candidatus Kaiserbacteria bacterium]